MVSTRSKRAEEAAAFFASQSAVVFRKTKKAKAVHNSLAEESRYSSNSDTTATIGEGTTPVDVSSSQAESESSSPHSPTSTSGSNIDKTITSSSHSLSRKDVPDSADGETSVAGVLSSSIGLLWFYPSPAKLAVVQTAPEDAEHYWYTLLGSEDEYTIEHIVNMLKAEPAMPGWKKIRLSLIVIVEGVLICGTQHIRASLPIVEMVRNLDTFFSYPWGRHAFDHTLRMIKVGAKVRNHNILINKLKQKTLVIHGFPIAIQLMLFQSIPLLLCYLPSSDDAQKFYDMSLSVLPTLKTYHTNNILLVENDKDLIFSQSVVSTEEDCVSVGDPKISHMLSLIRRGYRFSKGDWRGAIAKLTAEVAHLKNTYAELYVKLKADVVVELKSFLEERTCGSCSRNCGVCVGVPASRAESLSAAVVDTLKPVSSSKPLEEEENAALPSEVKTGKPKAFSSDTSRVYGCVENCSKDVTVNPESRLQTVDPSFQLSVREDDVSSNLQLALPFLPSTLEMHLASVPLSVLRPHFVIVITILFNPWMKTI
ncbi:hypothetical protein ISN44_As09g009660 [Arabidopsis suecica]|uniref:DUF1985 domain-containing protein n=1 Tax=Arabidopsis suecica TaxID=45249 RepID=A0A8T2AKN1_ARASU|nr:hypothetical protein ISN44_As09g009660 [Arabidopsis suecica]